MRLVRINPPLLDGQTVQCADCSRNTALAMADLEAPAGTFYCMACLLDLLREVINTLNPNGGTHA